MYRNHLISLSCIILLEWFEQGSHLPPIIPFTWRWPSPNPHSIITGPKIMIEYVSSSWLESAYLECIYWHHFSNCTRTQLPTRPSCKYGNFLPLPTSSKIIPPSPKHSKVYAILFIVVYQASAHGKCWNLLILWNPEALYILRKFFFIWVKKMVILPSTMSTTLKSKKHSWSYIKSFVTSQKVSDMIIWKQSYRVYVYLLIIGLSLFNGSWMYYVFVLVLCSGQSINGNVGAN